MTDSPKPKRRRFQYSLRTLLVLITIIGGLLAYMRARVDAYEADWREEQAALEAANALYTSEGVSVQANVVVVVGPAWLRLLAPADKSKVFERVESVVLNDKFPTHRDDTDALIINLKKLPHLQHIHMSFGGFIVIPSPLDSLLISIGAQSPLPSDVDFQRIQRELPNVVIDFSSS